LKEWRKQVRVEGKDSRCQKDDLGKEKKAQEKDADKLYCNIWNVFSVLHPSLPGSP